MASKVDLTEQAAQDMVVAMRRFALTRPLSLESAILFNVIVKTAVTIVCRSIMLDQTEEEFIAEYRKEIKLQEVEVARGAS
jgi:hypothetical protein